MKVNGAYNAVKAYSINKVGRKEEVKKIKEKDKIEISSLGKSLNNFGAEFDEKSRAQKVNDIKISIENGTYKVNSGKLKDALIKHMGESKNEY
ncbi:MAG: flagellar biosynthesis anti-sigma factor FlgM [Clostridium sp.]|uniref:flagellar biosynthesis anti-sigma factor FlgM n=1 Tax=Clostridium sp. TaxID=1506 RepID=UPI003F3BA725